MSTLTHNINPLQPQGFKLTIDRKNYPNLEFFAQSVTHPGISGDTPEERYRGQLLAGTPSALTFDDLEATILVDEDMNSYIEVINWLFRMVNENEVSQLNSGVNTIPHKCDILVTILTSANNANKKILYKDAYPVNVGSLALEVVNGETNSITAPVTFKYTRFEIQ